jgi:putative membrane protein
MNDERKNWLSRTANEALSKKLGIVAWILTAAVLVLVGLMRRPELRIPLPQGWSFGFLPLVHAVLNSLVAVSLIGAIISVKQGKICRHKKFINSAMLLSILFLLCYVTYHFTTVETKFGGTGVIRSIYLFLLISHISLAGLSLPCILFTYIAALTNRFADHRRLSKWVFPVWLYVALTGPVCYLMLRPYYG